MSDYLEKIEEFEETRMEELIFGLGWREITDFRREKLIGLNDKVRVEDKANKWNPVRRTADAEHGRPCQRPRFYTVQVY